MTSTPSADAPTARSSTGAPAAVWRAAGRALVAKALAELAYEELLVPVAGTGAGSWELPLPGGVTYRFSARRGGFGTWRVDTASVTREEGARGAEPADDPVRLVLDAREVLGLDGPTAAEVVRELTATHAADARILATAPAATELADLGYAELEQHLTGHPVLLLNKGRLGFAADDLDAYSPEARAEVRLRWYAASPQIASYQAVPGLDRHRLLREELGADVVAEFAARLAAQVDDPDGYAWLPVHPYQDETVVRTLFAPHLADGRLVPLGEAPVAYRPVQSVRTLVAGGHRDVKTPLLMRNTLVWRGLGTEATAAAPDVSDWLGHLHRQDGALRGTGLGFLREVASVVVRHEAFEALPDAPYRYGELLGAVWREPVEAHLRAGERARSLACLLHVDPAGRSLLAELVARSGEEPRTWLRRLCRALLPGLLHCLTEHGVAFCPHGENTVVVFSTGADGGRPDVPVRVLVKDFAEDVNLLPGRTYPGLPERADAVLVRWPREELAHSIVSAVFAGHFRFLAGVAAEHLGVAEEEFWALVRDELLEWRANHPDLAGEFDELGLLAPEVERIALNREHLTGGGFHDRAERDAAPDVVHGTAPNPVAAGVLAVPSC
ncbi:siderophore synthetase component [Kineococcus xinjiangensis]|uniref:Siderophore synthetase component n=1 Tax=Kineococcus xinjiangensis TaxID=512762 RepID=A0A2S6IDR9_9ACTN|nr:IucA/IucC family protein [Kineococcus xinjiangensis]PPK92336.1 siderophore synthetase component [Kineococcus xinjiangensis]